MPLAYHDDSPRLLSCAHTHDGCHADGGPLEINSTRNKRKDSLKSIQRSFLTFEILLDIPAFQKQKNCKSIYKGEN